MISVMLSPEIDSPTMFDTTVHATLLVMVIGLSGVQFRELSGDFKSAKRVARGRFEITSTITPELYDTKSYYQLIVSITKCEKLRN